jgi:predicted DNA-binding transcriptional regulator YafY
VRAWCAEKKEFSDFVLGRFTRASLLKEPAPVTVSADKAWQKMIAVRLIAHHELPESQQRILRTEYFAGAQARRISTRAALVPYLIQDLRAAIDPQKERPPDFQIEVANLAEIRPWLFRGTDTTQ